MELDRNVVAVALPGYVVGDEIGRGGWGTVLQARHTALGREVAVKQLPAAFAADQGALDRFISEARIIAHLDHPHILKVYDFVESNGTWLIVMELLSGGTLWDHFTRYGIRADQACGIALAMCSALEAAHDHGILHRDIKPENILFSADGVARLGDFGIAMEVDLDVRRTRAGEVIGTPTYMSPEQAWGHDLTPATDVYSLGIVLYEQLAGRVPFPEAKTPIESLVQHARDIPAPLSETAPDVPPAIAAVVMRALAKDVTDRYGTAREFGVALAEACGESFGPNWLHDSGTRLMGGGPIAAAALRTPSLGAPPRPPTMSHPALRADHFVGPNAPGADDDHHTTGAAAAGVDASGVAAEAAAAFGVAAEAEVAAVAGTATGVAADAGVWADGAAGGGEGPGGDPAAVGTRPADAHSGQPVTPPVTPAGAASFTPPGPPSGPPPDPLPGEGVPARSGSGGKVAAVLVAVLVLVVLGVGGFLVVRNQSTDGVDDGASLTTSTTETAYGEPRSTVTTEPSAPTLPTMVEPATTTTAPKCAGGERCIVIDDIALQGASYVIKWTAIGFEPSYAQGFFHAHFFWDIYSPDQAGTNASTFNVPQGDWEITDTTPFTGTAEITVANKPAAANRVCVTVGNFAHAVADPRQFDCVAIPTS